jgi:steroid delta-isomerase-like uncharacterized protein
MGNSPIRESQGDHPRESKSMRRRQSSEKGKQGGRPVSAPSALQVISEYVAAMATRDSERMDSLRSPDFVMDAVQGDAYEGDPLTAKETIKFWPAWFAGFSEMDLEVTRTIAAEEVVVAQWVFTGTHTGPLERAIFGRQIAATGRTVRFRGVSIYDVSEGLIRRETLYIDLATVMVELGVAL